MTLRSKTKVAFPLSNARLFHLSMGGVQETLG